MEEKSTAFCRNFFNLYFTNRVFGRFFARRRILYASAISLSPPEAKLILGLLNVSSHFSPKARNGIFSPRRPVKKSRDFETDPIKNKGLREDIFKRFPF